MSLLFDHPWSLQHFLSGFIVQIICFFLVQKFNNPLIKAFLLANTIHMFYEIKDLFDSVPSHRYIVDKIQHFVFGKEWTSVNDSDDHFINSYGDQICFLAGSILAYLAISYFGNTVSAIIGTVMFVISILIFVIARIFGPEAFGFKPYQNTKNNNPDIGPLHFVAFIAFAMLITLVSILILTKFVKVKHRKK